MRTRVLCLTMLIACAGSVADARDRAGSQRALSAQYEELKRVESCRWREVAQTPLYAVPQVGGFAGFLTWDCQIHAAQKATAAREAFERKHMRVAFGREGRSYTSARGSLAVSNRGDTAWYPSGFR